jgi:asparagine synthase (glutamine-hydrolysing)
MGALAGVLTAKPEDAKLLLEKMLLALRHRGAQTRVAVEEHIAHGHFVTGVGCSAHSNPDRRFLVSDGTAMAVDGTFFEAAQENQARFPHRILSRNPSIQKATQSIVEMPGAFAGLHYRKNRLNAFRDLNGLKPLYYSVGRSIVAFASERKALWRLGLDDAKRVLPGVLYSVGPRGLSKKNLARLPRPIERELTLKQASSQLSKTLKRAIRRVVSGADRVSVAFSGGLDSALTADLAKQIHSKVELLTVGLDDSPELSTAEDYAQKLNLPIVLEKFDEGFLEEYVRRVVWLIEEPNVMKVSVAIPLQWSAMLAARRGFAVMLCGQGSDELYGGYYKYARTLDAKGRRALARELYRSVTEAHAVNYERDDQATSPSGVELRTPFADLDVIRFSLMIPSEFKVKAGNDLMRKWVLRDVAKTMGLPDEIVWRRKKAIQHGTGVENAIRRLAKSQNLTVEAYLKKVHEEVRLMESMP